jgi:hypothetical protein
MSAAAGVCRLGAVIVVLGRAGAGPHDRTCHDNGAGHEDDVRDVDDADPVGQRLGRRAGSGAGPGLRSGRGWLV